MKEKNSAKILIVKRYSEKGREYVALSFETDDVKRYIEFDKFKISYITNVPISRINELELGDSIEVGEVQWLK